MDVAVFFNKWLHLISVSAVFGGILVAVLVLAPMFRSDEAGANSETARAVWRRFGMIQGILWLIVLATGFYNYYLVSPNVTGRYHMFAGMKMAFAILMFVIATALGHPAPALERLQKSRAALYGVLLALGIVVIGISAHLNISRVNRTGLKPAATSVLAPAPVGEPAGAPAP